MISQKMTGFLQNNSAIRAMFEEGKRMASIYGAENVYDFSLGNPNVPAPEAVNQAIKDILDTEDTRMVHGYMSNVGYEDVRRTIAESINQRFETNFNKDNLIMTVGAASGLNVIFKTLLNPGDAAESGKDLFECSGIGEFYSFNSIRGPLDSIASAPSQKITVIPVCTTRKRTSCI